MPVFEITEYVEATLVSVTPRNEKHGDIDKPALSIRLSIDVENYLLDLIDPTIRASLWKAKDEAQTDVPGVPESTPVLRCNSIDIVKLTKKYEGWTMAVDGSLDAEEPMLFGKCKLDALTVDGKQGGTAVLGARVGTSDIDATRSGYLNMHVGQSIWVKLLAPQKQPDVIDASSTAKDLPPEAGDMFAQQHNGQSSEVSAEGAWPFPGTPPDEAPPQAVLIEATRSGTRTARGRERTKAALEAGMKAAEGDAQTTH